MKKYFSMNKKQAVVFIIMMLTLVTIFSFSLFDGDSSMRLSDGFDSGLGQTVRKILSVFIGKERAEELNIRKLGHFFEYSVLGFEATLFVIFGNNVGFTKLTDILFFGMASALFDETIQLGREGRSGQISDVWLDLSGFTLCAALTVLIYAIARLIKRRSKSKA